MALVAGRFQVSYDMIDGTGKITVLTRDLRAADFTEALAGAAAHLVLLQATSGDKCVGYRVGQQYAENALGSLPAVTYLNSVQASISAAILDQPFKFASLSIPAPVIAVFVGASGPNANVVDVNAPIVSNYLADFTEAGHCFISDGESLDPVFNASGERVTKYRRLAKK